MAMHGDPTGNRATGSVQREWIGMAVLAIRIRRSEDSAWAAQQARRFTGIFRRLLTDPEAEVLAEIPETRRRACGLPDRGA